MIESEGHGKAGNGASKPGGDLRSSLRQITGRLVSLAETDSWCQAPLLEDRVAQIQRIFPDLVHTDKSSGHLMVDWAGLVGYLIESIKELDERLLAYEDRQNDTDRQRIEQLKGSSEGRD